MLHMAAILFFEFVLLAGIAVLWLTAGRHLVEIGRAVRPRDGCQITRQARPRTRVQSGSLRNAAA